MAFIKQPYSLSWSNQTKGKGSSAHADNYHMNERWIKHTHPSVYLYSVHVFLAQETGSWNPDFVLGKTHFCILCHSCVKSINATTTTKKFRPAILILPIATHIVGTYCKTESFFFLQFLLLKVATAQKICHKSLACFPGFR